MGDLLFPCGHEFPDSLHPEETLRQFAKLLREANSRLTALMEYEQQCNNKTQDILHYMELSNNQNASRGYALYKHLAEIRRERRACKEEIELLTPVVEFINSLGDTNQFLGRVTQVQGKCRSMKTSAANRVYRLRTSTLSEFMKGGGSHGH